MIDPATLCSKCGRRRAFQGDLWQEVKERHDSPYEFNFVNARAELRRLGPASDCYGMEDCVAVDWMERALAAEQRLADAAAENVAFNVKAAQQINEARARSARLREALVELRFEYGDLPTFWRRHIDTILKESSRVFCGRYMGDNDATSPHLTCIRARGHEGLCDNLRGDD